MMVAASTVGRLRNRPAVLWNGDEPTGVNRLFMKLRVLCLANILLLR